MICTNIAYEITPIDHPVVKNGKFLCRYCKLEMLSTTLYGQLLSCDCRYIKLGYNIDNSKIYCGLPKDIYKHGLTNEQHKKWTQILEKKGMIPFVLYPLICARCGELWPKFFMVLDEEDLLNKIALIL